MMSSHENRANHGGSKPVPAPRVPRSPREQVIGVDRPVTMNERQLITSQILDAASGLHSEHMSDAKAKTVLKEAVDAVVNSFAKHTHGYGRGKFNSKLLYSCLIT